MHKTGYVAIGAAVLALDHGSAGTWPSQRPTFCSQWDSGSDGAVDRQARRDVRRLRAATGRQTSIAGHTANTLAKLRADVVAGNAPPAVQLKGPEIAEWNATGMHRQHG